MHVCRSFSKLSRRDFPFKPQISIMIPCQVPRLSLAGTAASSLLLFGQAHGGSAVYKLHTDSSCSSSPTIIGFQETLSSSCSAITTCSSVNIKGEELYWDRVCASDKYDTLSAAAYENKPYVLMEIYESGANCKKLLSGAAFLADGTCLIIDNGASTMKVSLFANGSATFHTYRGSSCSGTAVRNTVVTKASITSHSCENGALQFYSSSATTSSVPTTDSSPKTVSTSTSQSAPGLFKAIAAITATLALAITLY